MSRTKMNVRIPFSAMWSGRRLVSKKSKSSRIVQRRVLHSEFLENRHLLTTFFGPSTFTVLDGFTQATAAAAGGTLLPGIFVASDPAADRHNDGTDPGLTGQFATSRRVDLDWTADAIPDPTNGSFVTAATNTGGVGSLGMNSGDGASATMTLSYNNFQTADPGCFFVLNTDTLIVHFFPTFDKGTNGLPIPFELYVNEPVDGTPHQTKFIDPDSPPGTDLEFPDESFDVSAFVGQQITSISLVLLGDLATDATISGIDAGFFEVCPEIHLEKLVNGLLDTEGDCPNVPVDSTVTYTYEVTNPGNIDLANVGVTDNPIPDSGQPTPVLGGDGIHNIGDIDLDDLLDASNAETWLFTATSTALVDEHDNLATATGFPGGVGPDSVGILIIGPAVQDTDPGCYFGDNPQIAIQKLANGEDTECVPVPLGGDVDYTYFVTNPGNVPIVIDSIIDDNATPGTGDDFTPTFTGGDTGPANGLLDPGETWTYEFTVTAVVGEHHNTVVINGHDFFIASSTVTADDEACYETTEPVLDITKFANGEDTECVDVALGSDVTYTYEVTVSGGDAVNVVVLDDNATPADPTDDFNPTFTGGDDGDNVLEPGETWTYEATVTALEGHHENIAYVNGDNAETLVALEEQQDEACYEVVVETARMTGGGSIFIPAGTDQHTGLRITHGFQLHCTVDANNRLEINWDNGAHHVHFHLSELTSVTCINDPLIDPPPPPFTAGGIDTMIGVGSGLFSGKVNGTTYKKAAATVNFTFTDAGEPGRLDTAIYVITVNGGPVVLDSGVPLPLTFGNHQIHPELKRLTLAAAKIQQQIDTTLNQLNSPNLNASRTSSLTLDLLAQFRQFEAATAGAAITGIAFQDVNKNGVQDFGEWGLAGVTVKLYSSTGQLIGTTTTDADGSYELPAAPGTYKVVFQKPAHYAFSVARPGTDPLLDSDVNVDGVTAFFSLSDDKIDAVLSAGLYSI